jgi:hypothetical protein
MGKVVVAGIISFVLAPSFLVPKNTLLFAAAAIPSRQAPQTTYRIHAHLYNSSKGFLLQNDAFNFFYIVVDRPNNVYLQLEGVVHFSLVFMINLVF